MTDNEDFEEFEPMPENASEKKKAGAKEYSFIGQVVAALWITLWSAYKFSKGSVEICDVVYSGIAIAACFSPVYISILFDKIKAIRFGD